MGWDSQFSRETEIAAIEQATNKPQDRELLVHGLDAFSRAIQSRSLNSKDLEPLREGLRRTDSAVWSRAGTWLVRLTNGFEQARQALREALTATRWTDRFHTVACLDEAAPASFRAELVRSALKDPDPRVRAKAADVCLKCALRELIPDLERTLAAESDPAARKTMQFALPLLRGEKILEEGRIIKRLRDGTITSHSESSRMPSESESLFVRAREVESILGAMRTYFEAKGRTFVRDSRTRRPLVGAKNVQDQGGRYFVLSSHPEGWVSIRERGELADAQLAGAIGKTLKTEIVVLPRKKDPGQADRLAASLDLPSPYDSYSEIENDANPPSEVKFLFVCFRKKELS